jgi:uncharacterized protein YutD
MNVYVVVEGDIGERYLYESWVPLVNPNLTYVSDISKIDENNFSILRGGGYPNYFDVIKSAVEDVNCYGKVDRLAVSVDSEELSYSEKSKEMVGFISQFKCRAEIKIVIQHFCLETWALGNQRVIRPSPQSQKLIQYKKLYDVRSSDLELLPANEYEEWNRAQFADRYLRCALNDKFRNLTYSKRNPEVLRHHKFFENVKKRCEETNHIASFYDFLKAFC